MIQEYTNYIDTIINQFIDLIDRTIFAKNNKRIKPDICDCVKMLTSKRLSYDLVQALILISYSF